MRKIDYHITRQGEQHWAYLQKAPGNLLKGEPLYMALKWIIEQLNLSMYRTETDDDGDICTMIIGKGASSYSASLEEVKKHVEARLRSLNFAGLFAKAREEGSESQNVKLVEKATVTRTPWAELSTEFHYALELVDMLKRLRETTFDFSPPGILGRAPDEVIFYLRQATRCFLYGLFEASVALARACVEEALKARLESCGAGIAALMKETKKTAKGESRGELERLISVAATIEILDGPSKFAAHRIRQHGNKVLHGRPLLEEASARQNLDDLRVVLDRLFAS